MKFVFYFEEEGGASDLEALTFHPLTVTAYLIGHLTPRVFSSQLLYYAYIQL